MKTTTSICVVFLFTPLFKLNAQNLWSEVTFNEVLTNETEWVYHETKFTASGEMQITKKDAFVQSPTFDFAIIVCRRS